MFSFSSPFTVASERIERCAAGNSVPGFEIPPFAATANILSSAEPDVDKIRENMFAGCDCLLKVVASAELRTFFSEIVTLAEEQCSKLYLQASGKNLAFAEEEFFALPFAVIDFYRLAAEQFSDGSLYALFDTQISFADAADFICDLNMPEILKAYFSNSNGGKDTADWSCGSDEISPEKQQQMYDILKNILPNTAAPDSSVTAL